MNTKLIWQIVLQLLLIALNAVFACAEIAVITMNDAKLARLAAEGNKKAIRLARLTSKPAKFLATIQVAITLSGFLGSAFASQNFAEFFVKLIKKIPGISIPDSVINSVCVVLITIILSYLTLVFGELVPKRVAMKKAEKIALGISGIISFISVIFAPIVGLLTVSTNGILRLLGIDPNAEDDEVSEEEIRMMVDVGSEKGVIDDREKEMIQNVFEFDDLTLDKFITHRTDVTFLSDEDGAEQWGETICSTYHSYYPICGETIDDVIGVLYAKDYFRLADRTNKENIMKNAVRTPYFVPEGLNADVLFKQMKKTGNKFAVVLDEYGGFSGIITITDLIEQIVGDLGDDNEITEDQPEIQKTGDNSWRILGSADLHEVAIEFKVTLPVDEYDTFGGYVFGLYGSVPDDGTTITVNTDQMKIDVAEISDHRAEVINVTLIPDKEPVLAETV